MHACTCLEEGFVHVVITRTSWSLQHFVFVGVEITVQSCLSPTAFLHSLVSPFPTGIYLHPQQYLRKQLVPVRPSEGWRNQRNDDSVNLVNSAAASI